MAKKENKLQWMHFAKDMRFIKDSYREQHEAMFGKRDIFHHTKQSGKKVFIWDAKKKKMVEIEEQGHSERNLISKVKRAE